MAALIHVFVLLLTVVYAEGANINDNILENLVARIEALEHSKCTTSESFETNIDSTDESIHSLREELEQVKKVLNEKEIRIQALENVVKTLMPLDVNQQTEKSANDSGDTNTLLQSATSAQNDESRNEESTKSLIRADRFLLSGQPIGFHAVNSYTEKHLGDHQILVFDTVLTNVGSAYHPNHGTFIAPIHGLYLFSITASSAGEAAHPAIATEIVKDGKLLAKTYAKSDTGYIDQGSVTVVAELQPNDEVWVRLNHPLDTSLAAGSFSSFSGILVYEYEA